MENDSSKETETETTTWDPGNKGYNVGETGGRNGIPEEEEDTPTGNGDGPHPYISDKFKTGRVDKTGKRKMPDTPMRWKEGEAPCVHSKAQPVATL